MALNRNHSQNGGVLVSNGERHVYNIQAGLFIVWSGRLSPLVWLVYLLLPSA